MASLTLTVTDEKLPRVIAAMRGMYAPRLGFTDTQWIRECIRQYIIRTVRDYENRLVVNAATVPEDDSLIT